MDADFEHSDYLKGYALSGKIMLSVIVILVFVVLLVVAFHFYARWYLLSIRRRQILRARNRRNNSNLVFYEDLTGTMNRGLDPTVLRSLPVLSYSSKTRSNSLECAVCLSEFEENELTRLLPKCNHSFHIDCIDMWFHSHSTCPLCRSPIEIEAIEINSGNVVISIDEPAAEIEQESGSELCTDCQQEEEKGTSSGRSRRKSLDVSINVPSRNEDELRRAIESPAFRSPMSRMLSLKRILSRDRRGSVSPSGSATELDIETRQTQCALGGTE